MLNKIGSIGRVIEVLSNIYSVKIEDKIISAGVAGKLKQKTNIVVGDIVEVEFLYDTYVIKNVRNRNNFLIRPPVANIDNLIICLSLVDPLPDYLLLDKELILCIDKKIHPVICINKVDMLSKDTKLQEEIDYINSVYAKNGIEVIYTSAKDGSGIEELKNILKGKISAFSGNSGVGKSSLSSIIASNARIEIGDISKKNLKGKNTTKYVRLYEIEDGTYILDTPGFSGYELFDIEYKKLKMYYKDFNLYKCKYDDCLHILEDGCSVKQAVEEEKIDKKRYERYKYMYQDLYEKDKRKYK